mgnify:CR=1 FL=1
MCRNFLANRSMVEVRQRNAQKAALELLLEKWDLINIRSEEVEEDVFSRYRGTALMCWVK